MNGFLFEFGNKAIFLESKNVNLTKKDIRRVINTVCDYRDIPKEQRGKFLYNEDCIKDFRRRINKAELEKRTTDNGYQYYSIHGRYFTMNMPLEDFERDVIVRGDGYEKVSL